MKSKYNMLSLVAMLLLTITSFAQDKVTTVKLVETLGQFETNSLQLKLGKHQFDVTNKNEDHEVAFFCKRNQIKKAKSFAQPVPILAYLEL